MLCGILGKKKDVLVRARIAENQPQNISNIYSSLGCLEG